MYETGIAHTLGKHVVPITQSLADVPFDTKHHRTPSYLPNGEGLASLERLLTTKLQQYQPPRAAEAVAEAAPRKTKPFSLDDDDELPF